MFQKKELESILFQKEFEKCKKGDGSYVVGRNPELFRFIFSFVINDGFFNISSIPQKQRQLVKEESECRNFAH